MLNNSQNPTPPNSPPMPKLRRFEFEKNSVGANWLIANMDNWTVKDIGFGSRSWIGCKFKTCGRNRIAVQHDGTWQEIVADIKRG